MQNVNSEHQHLQVYEIMLTQAMTHTHYSYITLIGVHEMHSQWLGFISSTLVSPQLAAFFLASIGWSFYHHSEDRLTVHIYYVECLAQGTRTYTYVH